MKILIQMGNLGSSVIDHLINPVAHAENIQKVYVFCHRIGPPLPNVIYRCPPKVLTKFPFASIIFEFFDLLHLAILNKSAYISGFLLFPHGLIAFIIAKLTKKKLILVLIAGRPEFYTKGTIQNIDFNYKTPPWFGKLLLAMVRYADAVVTTGSVTKGFLVKHGIHGKKIYPIISPANNSKFFPVKVPKVYHLLSVGNLSIIKHHEVLLLAVAEVKRKYPNIKTCIAGDGPRKSKLIKLSYELGINENVDFVGFQNDMPFYYNQTMIFVHTSEREGFPNVVLEAMACGLPVVVSNCGDIMDVTKDGFNSLVIEKFNDYEGFAQAIMLLLEDKELYLKISQNALQTIRELPVEDITRKWESIFEGAMFHESGK